MTITRIDIHIMGRTTFVKTTITVDGITRPIIVVIAGFILGS